MGFVTQEECRKSAVRRVRAFREEFGIRTVPVDCVRLLRDLQESGKMRLRWEEIPRDAPDFLDGITLYQSWTDSYLILTRQVPVRWQKYSSWRRYNFTLAHELGHVVFGHLKTPNNLKTQTVQDTEDMEADAFAAELLVPAEALGQFRTVQEAAEALLVSESAIRRRIRDTGVLLALRTCPACGFREIPPAADFCRMCGKSLQKVPHPPVQAEVTFLPEPQYECPVCGYTDPMIRSRVCPNCDESKRNYCLPEYNQPPHICPDDARFCEVCGAPTLYRELIWKNFRGKTDVLL